MEKKTLLLGCLIALGCSQISLAQSYEGYISGNLPVWADLNIPANDGSFSGTYFYKKDGGIIPLSGTLSGNRIILNETNKDGICTGIFTCTNFGDSITGNWNKPNSTKLSSVKLYKTDVSFKTYARIPDAAKLILLNGKSLNDELTEYTTEGSKKPKLVYLLAEKNILSTSFEWEYMGPYLSTGKVYHTFDLTKNKEISLLNEIDPSKLPALKSKMKIVVGQKLNEHKKTYTENEWIDAFGDKETYENSFKLSEVKDSLLGNYYLKSGMLNVVIDDYFAFPHVIQVMDFSFAWKLPFREMDLYLKDGSVLNNLK
ncbi:MAG: hypothetical protein NTX43_06585 [Bacteroidetes bacterium]|nr:hypothetical protein [Bacteroidota bacterium]